MGAWGAGPFDNDDAMDWTYELEAASDEEPVRRALAEASVDATQATVASVAIAAAEVVAAGVGRPAEGTPASVAAWISAHPAIAWPALVTPAIAALDQVGAGSELAELWAEDDDGEWREALESLRSRLAV